MGDGRGSAVLGTASERDPGVPAHFGEPLIEQRLLARGDAAVDLSHLSVLTVSGPDRLSWLNSLTTQELLSLRPGVSTETLILTPTGHVEYAMKLIDDGERTWMIVEPSTSAGLLGWLDSMRFMLRVEVADVTAEWAVIGDTRVDADPPATVPPSVAWIDPWPNVGTGSASYAALAAEDHPAADYRWRELIVPRSDSARLLASGGQAGTWAAEALRIAAWRPRLGAETDHRSLVAELDWLRTAVHLQKGCYRGQEAVARVHNLGAPPRRLVFLHLDGSGHVLPSAGAQVLGEVRGAARPVGQITSAALHYELGPIALAVVKRSTPADIPLSVTDGENPPIAAAQEEIVAVARERRAGVPPRNRETELRSR